MSTGNEPTHLDAAQLGAIIGAGLRRARKSLGLTQKQAAVRVGLTGEYYARLERGHALPSVPAFCRIVKIMPIDTSELLGLQEERNWAIDGSKEDNPAIARIINRLRGTSKDRVRFVKMLVDVLEERLGRG